MRDTYEILKWCCVSYARADLRASVLNLFFLQLFGYKPFIHFPFGKIFDFYKSQSSNGKLISLPSQVVDVGRQFVCFWALFLFDTYGRSGSLSRALDLQNLKFKKKKQLGTTKFLYYIWNIKIHILYTLKKTHLNNKS